MESRCQTESWKCFEIIYHDLIYTTPCYCGELGTDRFRAILYIVWGKQKNTRLVEHWITSEADRAEEEGIGRWNITAWKFANKREIACSNSICLYEITT